MKLLIIKEASTVSYIEALEKEGLLVERTDGIERAKEMSAVYFYDVIIADSTKPAEGLNQLLKQVKSDSPLTGIIVISGPVPVQQKIEILLTGADDYLVTPFSTEELSARIKSLIRRCAMNGERELTHREVKLTPANRRVSCQGHPVSLTRKEYELLFFFLRNPDRVLTHEMIAEYLWGDLKSLSADCFDFIYSHIKNIRRKLSGAGVRSFIDTVYGVGYIMK